MPWAFLLTAFQAEKAAGRLSPNHHFMEDRAFKAPPLMGRDWPGYDFCRHVERNVSLQGSRDADAFEARAAYQVQVGHLVAGVARAAAGGEDERLEAAVAVVDQRSLALPGLGDLALVERGQVQGHGLGVMVL